MWVHHHSTLTIPSKHADRLFTPMLSMARQFARDIKCANLKSYADPACNTEDNAVLACYPDQDTVLEQEEWSKFIW